MRGRRLDRERYREYKSLGNCRGEREGWIVSGIGSRRARGTAEEREKAGS